MQLEQVMLELEKFGNEASKNIYIKHGAEEPLFGVKVGDLKKIVKKIKKNQPLAEELWDTGNSDARYLAGLISDEKTISKEILRKWAREATWYMLSEYAVAWAASDSRFGFELAEEWIESSEIHVAAAGWSTWSNMILITPNEMLDIESIKALMLRASQDIHEGRNRVNYTKNGFIISAGTSIPELTEYALELGDSIGKVKVDMGETACKVPIITTYIQKVEKQGKIGIKKKKAKC